MSDTTNHKKAIEVLRVSRKTPGLLLDVLLQVVADDPAKIVNAYWKVFDRDNNTTSCEDCGRKEIDQNDKCGHCGSYYRP